MTPVLPYCAVWKATAAKTCRAACFVFASPLIAAALTALVPAGGALAQTQAAPSVASSPPSTVAPAPTGSSSTALPPDASTSRQTPAAPPSTGAATPSSLPELSSSVPRTTAGTGSSVLPHDLSPFGMFMAADVVVKTVMVGLALASLATWTILLAKVVELFGARRSAGRALSRLADAATLREAAATFPSARAIVARLVGAALSEAERSRGLPADGVKDRASALLSRIEARAGRAMGRGTGLLATIGSTAPFIGLFGTVWGIMNSFIGISKTNTTNLAVVAPGIAEALLATACGLVAAIPAVIIYNLFARGITGYRSLLGDASTEVMRLLSRDLDRDEAFEADGVRRHAAE